MITIEQVLNNPTRENLSELIVDIQTKTALEFHNSSFIANKKVEVLLNYIIERYEFWNKEVKRNPTNKSATIHLDELFPLMIKASEIKLTRNPDDDKA